MLRIVGLVVACLFVACIPSRPTSGLGVTRTDEGIRVIVNLCPGEELEVLRVETAGDFAPEESEVLWHIASTSGSTDTVDLGEVPPGYEELVPLDADLDSMEIVGLTAELNGLEVTTSFRNDEVTLDQVLLDGHAFTIAEFKSLDCNY